MALRDLGQISLFDIKITTIFQNGASAVSDASFLCRAAAADGIFFNYHYHRIKILIIFLAVHNYININARCLAALRKIRQNLKMPDSL